MTIHSMLTACFHVLFFTLVAAAEPLQIASRLELFVDDYVIDEIAGDARLHLHRPHPQEVVLTTDKPWEGNTSAYYSIFQDGDIYRMYYRGSHFDEHTKQATHREVTCYAESTDGLHWIKPNLGLYDFNGSKENNIVWDGIGTHCFTVFKDKNPHCSTDARYKALSRGHPRGKKGLYAFKSPDGIRWSLIESEPVITDGAFDSQNLAFWDSHTNQYREYHRTFVDGVRAIMTGTSQDFVHWTDPVLLDYGNVPNQHLYTNAVQSYDHAPQILIGFPTRYLPDEGQRVEPTLMASRDGVHFKRWLDAIIPEEAPEDRGGNRSNYMTWGLLELPTKPNELSVYASEAYYTGPDSRLRRFTYRRDGFVSFRASAEGGTLVTRPVIFSGNHLRLNFATKQTGIVRAELQDTNGKPFKGFTLADCQSMSGDSIETAASWKNDDVSRLAGKVVRVKFEVKNADLYSFRFN